MNKNCQNCGEEFFSTNRAARFCSDNCRALHYKANKDNRPVSTNHAISPRVQAPSASFMGLSGNPTFDYIFHKTKKGNESLKNQNRQLLDRIEKAKDEFRELKLRYDTYEKMTEAEKALEASKGLSGIEKFATSPTGEKLMEVIAGLGETFIKAKFGNGGETASEDILAGAGENRMLIEAIVSLLSDKDQDFLAHYVKLTQYLSTNPTILPSLTEKINEK